MVKQKIKIELPTEKHSKYIAYVLNQETDPICVGEGNSINEAIGDLFLQLIDADKIDFEVVKLNPVALP